jgi:hypothetical protein
MTNNYIISKVTMEAVYEEEIYSFMYKGINEK